LGPVTLGLEDHPDLAQGGASGLSTIAEQLGELPIGDKL
jgi:hypothetical protein